MTDPNKTEIAVVLDRSGSMQRIRADMIGGFATFVAEQMKVPGHCVLSLYQFDDRFDTVYEEKPLAEVGELALAPRGSTALLDAVGRTITLVGERLAKKPETERPGAVIIVIITDGCENASHEFQLKTVRELVEKQERDYNWRFMYLGADASTFAEAQAIGIRAAAHYDSYHKAGVGEAYAASSNAVASYRSAVQRGMATHSLVIPASEHVKTSEDSHE